MNWKKNIIKMADNNPFQPNENQKQCNHSRALNILLRSSAEHREAIRLGNISTYMLEKEEKKIAVCMDCNLAMLIKV